MDSSKESIDWESSAMKVEIMQGIPYIMGWMWKTWWIQKGNRVQRDVLSYICPSYRAGLINLQEMFFQSTPNILSIPSVGFGQAFSRFQDHLQQEDPLAPAEPEQYWPFLEEGHGPSESPKAVPCCFQCPRGPYPMEIPKIMHITLGVRCNSHEHGKYKEVSWFLEFNVSGVEIQTSVSWRQWQSRRWHISLWSSF